MGSEVEAKESKAHEDIYHLRQALQQAKIDLRHRTEKIMSENVVKEKASELKVKEAERVKAVILTQKDDLSKALRVAKSDLIMKLREARDNEATIRKEANVALGQLQEKCRHNERLIEKLEHENLQARSEFESNIARTKQERDNCRDDACRIAREKHGLVNNSIDTERESANLKEQVSIYYAKLISLGKETDALRSELKIANDEKMLATRGKDDVKQDLEVLGRQLSERDDMFRREIDVLKQRSSNMLKNTKAAMKSEVRINVSAKSLNYKLFTRTLLTLSSSALSKLCLG